MKPDNCRGLYFIYLVLMLLTLSACGDPVWNFAGGGLSGEETPLVQFPTAGGVMQIETLPADPYSVNIGYVLLNGKIYIDPADSRQWYQNILSDPNVRIRFDDSEFIHPMLAVKETDPALLALFDADRNIIKLEPKL